MAKKVKKHTQSMVFIWVALVVILFLVAGFITRYSLTESKIVNKQTQAQNIAALREVTSPSPTLTLVPQNSGRSVKVPILTYHYIGNNPNPGKDSARDNLSIPPDKFEAQMAYIAESGYSTISLDTLYAVLKGGVSLPAKPIILTFDDGYIDFYVNAYPVLKRYNLHATAFIPTGLLGQGYYMSWDQVKEVDNSGLVTFQAHSVSHANLPALTKEQLDYQLKESKRMLEEKLGKPINFMAYPYGVSNETLWQAVKEAGYLGAVGTWVSDIESEGNIYNMPRIKIPGNLTLEDFKQRI